MEGRNWSMYGQKLMGQNWGLKGLVGFNIRCA